METVLEKICANCNNFFTDDTDFNTTLGICIDDPELGEYIDEILENMSAECCMELYRKRRYESDKEACDMYSEIEVIYDDETDDDSEDEIDEEYLDKRLELIQSMDLSEVKPYLYSEGMDEKAKGMRVLQYYAGLGNPQAYTILKEYIAGLPPIKNIEETHHWLRILEVLEFGHDHEMLSELFLQLLLKLQSNATTRQVFTEILRYYKKDCPENLAKEKLRYYLEHGKYGPKLRLKIEEILYPVIYNRWLDN